MSFRLNLDAAPKRSHGAISLKPSQRESATAAFGRIDGIGRFKELWAKSGMEATSEMTILGFEDREYDRLPSKAREILERDDEDSVELARAIIEQHVIEDDISPEILNGNFVDENGNQVRELTVATMDASKFFQILPPRVSAKEMTATGRSPGDVEPAIFRLYEIDEEGSQNFVKEVKATYAPRRNSPSATSRMIVVDSPAATFAE